MVSHARGAGQITTVGTLPNPSLAADLARWLDPGSVINSWPDRPASVTVSSATNAAGRRVHVLHNWSWAPVRVPVPTPLEDLLVDATDRLDSVELRPWDVRVLGE